MAGVSSFPTESHEWLRFGRHQYDKCSRTTTSVEVHCKSPIREFSSGFPSTNALRVTDSIRFRKFDSGYRLDSRFAKRLDDDVLRNDRLDNPAIWEIEINCPFTAL